MTQAHPSTDGREARLHAAVAVCLEEAERGQPPGADEIAARFPEFAAELVEFFGGREQLERLAGPLRRVAQGLRTADGAADRTAGDETPPGPGAEGISFGDYEVLGEIARGGMGVVYRARQKGLNRLVALKMVPERGLPEEARRFRNEAEMVAGLDHPGIVPIYEVGEHEGHLYFSMKLIEGGSLAQHLDRYRNNPREAAWLLAAVARAVHHAHQRGVLHRDLKPSNILVGAEGQPHVTDFGLAKRVQADTELTQSGVLVGTPSYMAPEQTTGRRGEVTTVTDVYGLGAVLYALLTGRPPFRAETVLDTLALVRESEPEPPRRCNRKVNRDLETVCLKCLNKDPAQRYGSAEALADDLEGWLCGEPVRARRRTWTQRLGRWARRHRPLVGAAAAVLLVAAVLVGSTLFWWAQKRTGAEASAHAALEEATRLGQEEKWPEALSAVKRAGEVLAGVGADPELRQEIEELDKDLEMGRRLQEASLRGAAVKEGHFDEETRKEVIAAAFAWYGLDVTRLAPPEAAARIQSRPIRPQLVAALGEWACLDGDLKGKDWNHLLAICRLADPDPWRNRLRDAWERKDFGAVEQLLAAAPDQELPRGTAVFLANTTRGTAAAERAVAFLLQERLRHPADFWVNHELGACFFRRQPSRPEEAIRYWSVAAALRPESPGTRLNLGLALKAKGRLDEAIQEYRAAIALDPKYAQAHHNLGNVLYDMKQQDEAITEYRAAIALDPKFAAPHIGLGNALYARKQLDEAIREYRAAIALDPKDAKLHTNLGLALYENKQLDEAIREYRAAIALNSKLAPPHNGLGKALAGKKLLDEAIREYRAAIALDPKDAKPHNGLGIALRAKGQVDEAIREYRTAIALDPRDANPHTNLGVALYARGQVNEAIREYRAAITLDPKLAAAHIGLGNALYTQKQLDEAIREYRAAITLDPKDAMPHTNLGILLNAQGRLDEAIREHRAAIALDPKNANPHTNLGNVLRRVKGRLDEAIREYRTAIALDPRRAEHHGALGQTLAMQGCFAEAREATQRCLDLLPPGHPMRPMVTQQLRQCEQSLALDQKLAAILEETEKPADAELLKLAWLCRQPFKKLNAASARFYAEAFARDPKLSGGRPSEHRYNAACAAALAGCGRGEDAVGLAETERVRHRRQALSWLRDDLVAWRRLLATEPDNARPAIAKQMRHWLSDTDFDGVRGPVALAKLPEAECKHWQKLWAEVEELRTGAGDKAPERQK